MNADGSMALSVANTTFPKNQVFDMLNPELYPSIVLSVSDYKYKGFYSGHAYRYDADNVTRYAIVLQTNAGATTQNNRYHYYLAIQR